MFCYLLGPLPWVFSGTYGMPRKTNKAKLLQLLERGTILADLYPKHATSTFDGMAVLQMFQPSRGSTFHTLAETVFQICTSQISRSVQVVFHIYPDVSIKNPERTKRAHGSSEGARYNNILPLYPTKSSQKLIAIKSNKT